jgi:hypothetical protein
VGGKLVEIPEPPTKQTISEIFEKVLPFYIAIGMPPAEFWDGDVTLVKAYRKAYEYKKQEWNVQAYLNGMYVYDALIRVAPIFHAFAKRGTKPMEYRDKPIEILTSLQQKKAEEVNKSRDMQLRMIEKFKKINQHFEQKK